MTTSERIIDLATLLTSIQNGGEPRYLCFWGHRTDPDGRVGKTCLSQWYPAAFKLDGIHYLTAEHYMMAEKARLFGDESVRQQILSSRDPGKVKAFGRQVRAYDDDVWAEHRFDIVVKGSVGKFSQNASLRSFLLGTQGSILVEASPVDSIWGIGLEAAHRDAENPPKWLGLNLLGFALMEAREQIAQGTA